MVAQNREPVLSVWVGGLDWIVLYCWEVDMSVGKAADHRNECPSQLPHPRTAHTHLDERIKHVHQRKDGHPLVVVRPRDRPGDVGGHHRHHRGRNQSGAVRPALFDEAVGGECTECAEQGGGEHADLYWGVVLVVVDVGLGLGLTAG